METPWQDEILAILREDGVQQMAYVPDAGHAQLIRRVHASPACAASC